MAGENVVRIEKWEVDPTKAGKQSLAKVTIEKVAVRNRFGQFHGATNFRGSVLR